MKRKVFIEEMHLKMSSVIWQPFCLTLNVLRIVSHNLNKFMLQPKNYAQSILVPCFVVYRERSLS